MMYLSDDMTEQELREARDEQRELPQLADVLAAVIAEQKKAVPVFDRLLSVAGDYEADVLVELALRAGILWHCDCKPGGWDNTEGDTSCSRCGKARTS